MAPYVDVLRVAETFRDFGVSSYLGAAAWSALEVRMKRTIAYRSGEEAFAHWINAEITKVSSGSIKSLTL